MTKEEFAARITGCEEVTVEMQDMAEAHGLVVVFISAYDTLKICGAIRDQEEAMYLDTVWVVRRGIVRRPMCLNGLDDYELERVVLRWLDEKWDAVEISIGILTKESRSTWILTSSICFAPFDYMVDGVLHCHGVILDINDFPQGG